MQSAVHGLNTLLAGILDISRLDAGVVVARCSPSMSGRLIEQMSEEDRAKALKKALSLRSSPRVLWTRTDPALLERAIRNLIENALNYTQKGGVLIGARICGGRVSIDVIDTGIGVPADQQRQIFEGFIRSATRPDLTERDWASALRLFRVSPRFGAEVQVASRENAGRGSR